MQRKSKGLPEALLEGVLIVFAVLVALGVDEYWEGREEQELARVALERVAVELQGNRAELLQSRGNNLDLVRDLGNAIEAYASGADTGIRSVNYEVSLLGADAWETARVTRAVHFMDFDKVSRISKVYRVQQLYLDRQDEIVARIAGIGGRDGEIDEFFGSLRGGLGITLRMECDLVAQYDSLLVELPTDGTASASSVGTPLPGCD